MPVKKRRLLIVLSAGCALLAASMLLFPSASVDADAVRGLAVGITVGMSILAIIKRKRAPGNGTRG